MAALDFGMAFARGLIPTSQEAQQDLINRAGGRNIFKSEDWWNTQVNKQLQEGYAKQEKAFEYLTTSGEWKPGQRREISTASGMDYLHNPFLTGEVMPRVGQLGSRYVVYIPPEDASVSSGQYDDTVRKLQSQLASKYPGQQAKVVSASYEMAKGSPGRLFNKPNIINPLYTQRPSTGTRPEFFTAGELSDIESAARRGAEEAKRETAASKAGRKRVARGTGGLVGKAVGPDTTGLPALGSGGLGLTASLLGTETKL